MISSTDQFESLVSRFPDLGLTVEDNGDMPVVEVARENILEVLEFLRDDPSLKLNYLCDLSAADGMKLEDEWPERFIVVYHLGNMNSGLSLRIKVPVSEYDAVVPSATGLWSSADWLEREVFDLFGIKFTDHPNLKRIMTHHRFEGHALRKDYHIHDGQWLDEPESLMDEIGEYGENPEDGGFSELIPVNIGPAHPATHGTLRFFGKLDGETIVKVAPEIGYLHRGFEKHCETGTWTMVIPYTDRLNYCSAMLNNVGYCYTVEKMLDVEVPERTQYIRVIISELSRIIDHCVCLGAMLVDLGALTNFWYLFNLRERVYTIMEELCGARLTSTYVRVGGLAYDLNPGFVEKVRELLKEIPKGIGDVLTLVKKNRIFLDRTVGIGVISQEMAMKYSWTGPCLRATGIDYDVRKVKPYYQYADFDWDVPTRTGGDVHDRALIRFDEIIQSMRIIEQALDKLPGGPIMSDDKRVQLPEKEDVYGNIEGLMNHFVLVYDGIKVPEGEAYHAVEGANGELGFYIISDGSGRPYRVRCRPPCFTLLSAFAEMTEGGMIADAIPTLGSLNIIAGELDR